MDQADTSRLHYQSYLVRFWREDAHKPWRATVLRSGTEHIYHFATFETLMAFFNQRLADKSTAAERDADSMGN